jgi:hypothetical protein
MAYPAQILVLTTWTCIRARPIAVRRLFIHSQHQGVAETAKDGVGARRLSQEWWDQRMWGKCHLAIQLNSRCGGACPNVESFGETTNWICKWVCSDVESCYWKHSCQIKQIMALIRLVLGCYNFTFWTNGYGRQP